MRGRPEHQSERKKSVCAGSTALLPWDYFFNILICLRKDVKNGILILFAAAMDVKGERTVAVVERGLKSALEWDNNDAIVGNPPVDS